MYGAISARAAQEMGKKEVRCWRCLSNGYELPGHLRILISDLC